MSSNNIKCNTTLNAKNSVVCDVQITTAGMLHSTPTSMDPTVGGISGAADGTAPAQSSQTSGSESLLLSFFSPIAYCRRMCALYLNSARRGWHMLYLYCVGFGVGRAPLSLSVPFRRHILLP
jgi:hypothetical protein